MVLYHYCYQYPVMMQIEIEILTFTNPDANALILSMFFYAVMCIERSHSIDCLL